MRRSKRAVRFAEQSDWEPVEDLKRFVYAERATLNAACRPRPASPIAMPCARRLRAALQRDPRVFLMGEDIGRYGGCFAVTKGLLEEFGEERIRDTPLSESAFVGAGIGAALGGMRPIVEIMTVNFSLLALDQILNNAATLLPHVGRPVHRAARDPHGDRRGPAGRRSALAQSRRLVRPHSGAAHRRRRRRSTMRAACWPLRSPARIR